MSIDRLIKWISFEYTYCSVGNEKWASADFHHTHANAELMPGTVSEIPEKQTLIYAMLIPLVRFLMHMWPSLTLKCKISRNHRIKNRPFGVFYWTVGTADQNSLTSFRFLSFCIEFWWTHFFFCHCVDVAPLFRSPNFRFSIIVLCSHYDNRLINRMFRVCKRIR